MSKQTAVNLLVSKLNKEGFTPVLTNEEIQEALQMEREQIIQAHGNKMRQDIENNIDVYFIKTGEQYYNEIYGGQDE